MILAVERSTTWQHFQVRFSEWFGAACLFAWGIYVTLHPGMFTAPGAGVMFSGMVAIMPQQSWGLMAVLTGFARLAALYVNGHHKRTPSIRLVASFFSAFVWTQVVVGLYNAGIAQTGVVIYTAMVCADIYSAFRASGDVTVVARLSRQKNEGSRGDGISEAHS